MIDFFEKSEYDESDILALIKDEAEESVHLDFKSSGSLGKEDKKKDEIAKDVSSFANSDGGIIVYGIEEENHRAKNLSVIAGDEITKEWLEQVINSRIQPVIENIRIFPIRFENDILKSVYVVKIPVSKNAPHQASDKRYYKRYNFKSSPMEEYEVRNLYSRLLPAKLKLLEPVLKLNSSFKSTNFLSRIRYEISFKVQNVGTTIEKDYKLIVHFPKQIQELTENQIFKFFIEEDENYKIFSIPNQSPIFQNENDTVCTCRFKIESSIIKTLIEASSKLKLKLLYTSGTDEREYILSDLLYFEGKKLSLKDFGI